MNILKILILFISMTLSSYASAQILLFEMRYPADEQPSGCAVHHGLYLSGTEQVSMQWVAESVCSGSVMESEHVTFSENTMKAWPVLLHKAAAWADQNSLEQEIILHHWGKNILVKAVQRIDVLGEKHIYFAIQNENFSPELRRPMLIEVSKASWKQLANAIAQYVSLLP